MTDFTQIKQAIDLQGRAFDLFIKKQDDRLDTIQTGVDELRDRIEDVEMKASRPSKVPGEFRNHTREQKEHLEAFEAWLRKPTSHDRKQVLENIESKVASGLSDGAGGAAVPEILLGDIITRIKDGSPMRQLASVYPVTSGDVKQVVSNNDATSAWVGETSTRNATSEPTFTERKATFGTVYAYVAASEELVFDSAYPVTEWFTRTVGDQLAQAEGQAFISGDGSDKPTGLLNTAPETAADGDSPARTSTALQYIATGVAANFSRDYRDSPSGDPLAAFFDAMYSLKAGHRRNAVWLMNSNTQGTVRKFRDADGRSMWMDGLAPGAMPTFLGYPVYTDENLQDVGANAFPVMFGDFAAGYSILDAGGLRVTIDNNITTPGRVKWYIRKRVGGIILDNNAIKTIKIAAS